MDKIFCDILVSGAGIIGSTLALRLAQCGFQIVIIDSNNSILLSKDQTPGPRVSAINFSSVQLLTKVNILKKIKPFFYTKFQKLEIWECLSSKVIFDSSLLNVPNMGMILENNRLQCALWEKILTYDKLNFYHPCFLTSMHHNGKYWELTLSDNKIINTLLLIGADGSNSFVRKKAKISVTGWKYRQFCMSLSLTYTKNQNNTVWQNFTPFGPRGFLPLYDQWGSLMWYDNIHYIHKLQNLSKFLLEKKIEKRFGNRLGSIKIYKNIYFSLLRQHAHSYIKEGLVLVGDAAHTINPLAGQGINLGLRDVDVLVKILKMARNRKENWYSLKILKRYQSTRWPDNLCMQTGIDFLYFIFSNKIPILQNIRRNSLILLEKNTALKKTFLKYALGFKY